MKKIFITLLVAGAFAACHSGIKGGSSGADSSAPSEATDKTAMASDSAKQSSDSMVTTAPDTVRAK